MECLISVYINRQIETEDWIVNFATIRAMKVLEMSVLYIVYEIKG